jgi:hypothetical protein
MPKTAKATLTWCIDLSPEGLTHEVAARLRGIEVGCEIIGVHRAAARIIAAAAADMQATERSNRQGMRLPIRR